MSNYTIPRPAAGDITDLITDDHRLFEDLMRDMRDVSADRDGARTAFAALLIAILRSDEVRGILLGIVRQGLSLG